MARAALCKAGSVDEEGERRATDKEKVVAYRRQRRRRQHVRQDRHLI